MLNVINLNAYILSIVFQCIFFLPLPCHSQSTNDSSVCHHQMTAHTNPIPTLNFSLSPKEIISLTKQEIETANSFFSQLLSIPIETRTVNNVLLPWARWEGQFTTNSTNYVFVKQVSPDSEVRDAAVEASKLLDQFAIEQSTREDLYLLAKSVTKEQQEDPEITRFREKLLREFRLNGLELNPEQREVLKGKRQRLAELAIDFSNTMNSDKTELVLSKEQLEGCPDHFLESLRGGMTIMSSP